MKSRFHEAARAEFAQATTGKAAGALQIRKNSAATSRPPIACGFVIAVARFPRPRAVTPLAAGLLCLHAPASWASVAPAALRRTRVSDAHIRCHTRDR